MALFQNSILSKYSATLDEARIDKAYNQFCDYFKDPERQKNILKSKEEQFQEGFLRELFVKILGYTLNPDPDYNLITEKKDTRGSKKADGAILQDGEVLAVIELKDHKTTDLNKVERQAFGYKNQHKKATYVIISNFQRLRFYIDNAVEYVEWNLFTLSREDFTLMWLCLSQECLLKGLPKTIKNDSVSSEEQITNKLYKDYIAFKRELFKDILQRNTTEEGEKSTPEWKILLFKKTQKLLDRMLFIFFAEDCGLLPPNSIHEIIEQWRSLMELDAYSPLYSRLKKYFGYMNTGFKGKKYEIFAYNGGLFKPDEVLDSLEIDDELLALHTQRLSDYDFQSDVDVNILGHIFENSLSEIEEVTAQLEQGEAPAVSKRKKDGVFYTPQYITKYIVENTVGRLCQEKKDALGINEVDYFDDAALSTKKRQQMMNALTEYREWLLQITICDPACGSGAFLNAALRFLMDEHRMLDEMEANITGSTFVFPNVENSILENNLYGVDINEESVEIARLALWLRTAKPYRKLTTLNDNIKCGNSLISDPEVAGEKAFDWQKEFPKVFEKGGFDVVIGNPPYVRVQQLDYKVIDYLKEKYTTALKRIDLSLCFIEKSRNLIKENGRTSYITSNQFLTTEYGQAMRQYLLSEYFLTECVDFGDLPIFPDAMTYVSIFSLSKVKTAEFKYAFVKDMESAESGHFTFKSIFISKLTDANWNLNKFEQQSIFDNMLKGSVLLGKLGNAGAGLFTGYDDILMFDKEVVKEYDFEEEMLLPVLRAENCNRYYCTEPEKMVLYPYKIENGKTKILNEDELAKNYPKTYKYLLEHKSELGSRKDSRKTFADRKDWYTLTRFGQLNTFNKQKIVSPGEVKSHKFCIDSSKSGFSCARVFAITLDTDIINLEYLLCLLNSNLAKAFLQSFSSLKSGGYYSYSSNVLNRFPVKDISPIDQQPFITLADTMLTLTADLQKLRARFHRRLRENLGIEKITTALETFDHLTFEELQKELKKQKVKLTLTQQDEWEDYFTQYKQQCAEKETQMTTTDHEIDELVYDLYGLTDEEKEIVRG